jgi:hypothetical protein
VSETAPAYEDLLIYIDPTDKDWCCPKCQYHRSMAVQVAVLVYCNGYPKGRPDQVCSEGGEREHFHHKCPRCNYGFVTTMPENPRRWVTYREWFTPEETRPAV